MDIVVREIERQGKNFAVKKTEERKRLIFLGLHRKPIKLRDKEFALVHGGHRCLPGLPRE